MKTFLCKVCGHIEFNEAPGACPVCGAPKTSFVEKPDIIQKPGSSQGKGEAEAKHIPKIVIVKKCDLVSGGCVDAHAKIGEVEHPMLKEHYITFIDFYLDKAYLARVYLTPERMNPAAALHLKSSSGELTVVEHCNIHGYWMSATVI